MSKSLNKTIIPIILSSDNEYAPYMYTTMLSILKNANPTTLYDFYLLIPTSFSINNENKINELKNIFPCKINFINMKNAFSDLSMQISHITTPTYYRLLAADILPKYYDKCIYLDVDICVCKDLSEMYNIDMEDNFVAGVVAAGYYFKNNYNSNRLNIPNSNTYINAGSIILNLKEIRKNNLTETFLKLSKNNYSSQDQDVINVACYGKVKLLPLKYNFMTKYLKNLKSDDFNNLYGNENILEAEKDPVIIHFADKIKPWQQIITKYDEIWWSYAKQTPYYKIFNPAFKTKLFKLDYYRYKVLSKILWGKKRKKYKQKYKELKTLKKYLKHK